MLNMSLVGEYWPARLWLVLCFFCGACAEPGSDFQFDVPVGIPDPVVPDANPMSQAKVELGRHLFYDTRLSENQTQSCASCHLQTLAFAEDRTTSVGSTGDVLVRNSMSLINVAYNSSYTWANPVLTSIEQQILIPIFAEDPIELGLAGQEDKVLSRLQNEESYDALFKEAYPDLVSSERYAFGNVTDAIASFVRSLVSFNAPYDRYIYDGERGALSASAQRGLNLFFEEELECFHCHGGFTFSDSTTHESTEIIERPFHNNGLYNLSDLGGYPNSDQGLFDVSEDPRHIGLFRAPSLRNIELTAPYMHDGSVSDLNGVIEMYAAGGRLVTEGALAGDGRLHPNKSEFVDGFELNEQIRTDVLEFLRSLTDPTIAENEAWSNPW